MATTVMLAPHMDAMLNIMHTGIAGIAVGEFMRARGDNVMTKGTVTILRST